MPRSNRRLAAVFLCALGFTLRCQALALDFSGSWNTDFGPLHLVQEGNRLRGSYVMEERLSSVEGTVKDREAIFRYQERSAHGEGRFQLSTDGASFTGTWRQEGNESWSPWSGRRSRDEIPGGAGFEGLWISSYGRLRLQATAQGFTGVYAHGGGARIDGKVVEGRLTFRYDEGGAQGEGLFELAAGGRALLGRWRAEGTREWKTWNAIRLQARNDRSWLVVFEAPWEASLEVPEYSFGAMCKAFFARKPKVRVRQRFFSSAEGLQRWCRELSLLAEPILLVIASHGRKDGIQVAGRTIGVEAIARSLRCVPHVKLLHFSACRMMMGNPATVLDATMPDGLTFPVSGYTTAVDWGASALIEFLYYDLILSRGLEPARAAAQLKLLLPFAGERSPEGSILPGAGFVFTPPPPRATMQER